MGSARTVAASAIITQVLYELRDPNGNVYNKDGNYAELMGYLNRCSELIYEILVDKESELIRTGSGTLTTVDGTQSYALSSNDMGDLWTAYWVWIVTKDFMTVCEEWTLEDAITAEEAGDTSRSEPDQYCLIGDDIWFRDVPDDEYTVRLRYYPNFIPLSATTEAMPYKNLFNNDIIEGIKLFAKNRNERSFQAEAILKDRFMARAMQIMEKRRRRDVGFEPIV